MNAFVAAGQLDFVILIDRICYLWGRSAGSSNRKSREESGNDSGELHVEVWKIVDYLRQVSTSGYIAYQMGSMHLCWELSRLLRG